MSEPLETLDKDKQAMSEAIRKDIEKDKENLARVKADRDEKGYEKDDDKKAEKLDKEIARDKASPNDDKLYEEDDRVKRDKERDDALRDKEKAKDDRERDDAIRDKEKAKDDACMVRADDDTIDDDEEYGDDDKLRDEILGVMEELCDTLNDSLNFKKVVCMGIKVSIAFKFLIFCSQSFRKNSDSKDLSFR
ncbi:prohead core protein [Helicobacter pylori]